MFDTSLKFTKMVFPVFKTFDTSTFRHAEAKIQPIKGLNQNFQSHRKN